MRASKIEYNEIVQIISNTKKHKIKEGQIYVRINIQQLLPQSPKIKKLRITTNAQGTCTVPVYRCKDKIEGMYDICVLSKHYRQLTLVKSYSKNDNTNYPNQPNKPTLRKFPTYLADRINNNITNQVKAS